MQLNLERPDYQYFLRGADGVSALVNDRRLTGSFVLAPNTLIEAWAVRDARALTADPCPTWPASSAAPAPAR